MSQRREGRGHADLSPTRWARLPVPSQSSSPDRSRPECVRVPEHNSPSFYTAHVLYKTTDYYAPEHERTLAWNDPDLKIDWELEVEPIVSEKDQRGLALRDAETFE